MNDPGSNLRTQKYTWCLFTNYDVLLNIFLLISNVCRNYNFIKLFKSCKKKKSKFII